MYQTKVIGDSNAAATIKIVILKQRQMITVADRGINTWNFISVGCGKNANVSCFTVEEKKTSRIKWFDYQAYRL